MQFFAWVFAILIILATVFFIPVLITYVQTGEVPNFPTLIVCGFVVMAAIQSLFSGLILSTIKQKNRQDFEIEIQRAYRDKTKDISREK